MGWIGYMERVSGGATQKEQAAAAGVSAPTVSRWRSGHMRPEPNSVAAFARHYGRPVLEAFIAAGFLTAQEAGERPAAAPSLDQLTDDELLAEIGRRLRERAGDDRGYTASMSQVDYDLAADRQDRDFGRPEPEAP